MVKFIRLSLVILAGLLVTGCPPASYTRGYTPVSEAETRAFAGADQNVFPNDVRKEFAVYGSTRIVWPGIVISAESTHADNVLEMRLVVEHHYYDWMEDFGRQPQRMFLSPRGEGKYVTIWRPEPNADTIGIVNSAGDMIIVYGVPIGISDSAISVNAYHVRVIDRGLVATDVFDYGRPGEPIKVLRLP